MRYLVFAIVIATQLKTFAVEPAAKHLIIQPDAFQTLVNPPCSYCRIEAKRRSQELRDDDRALCWIRGHADGGAIPIRFFLNAYRVISDSYGVFVYDPDAGYARGFAPSYDFSFYGWRNGVMVMKNKDGTLYSCLTGIAFEGPKAGTKLEAIPTLVSNWGDWLAKYPNTVAYHMFDKYQPTDLPNKEFDASRNSRVPVDARLAGDKVVLGVASGDAARAYLLDDLKKSGFLHEKIGDQDRIVLWNDPTNTAAAYLSVADPPDTKQTPRRITLARDETKVEKPFVDKETGSHWDIAGRATDGELKGWTLQWLDGTQVKWFAWAAEYPKTSIYPATASSR